MKAQLFQTDNRQTSTLPAASSLLRLVTRRTTDAGEATGQPAGVWRSLRLAWRRGRLRRESIRQLRRLDDRLLADIGVHRTDIERTVDALLDRQGAGDHANDRLPTSAGREPGSRRRGRPRRHPALQSC